MNMEDFLESLDPSANYYMFKFRAKDVDIQEIYERTKSTKHPCYVQVLQQQITDSFREDKRTIILFVHEDDAIFFKLLYN